MVRSWGVRILRVNTVCGNLIWCYVTLILLDFDLYSGYHEVPEESKSRISPAFQITNKSETTEKIIPHQPKAARSELPHLKEKDIKTSNETVETNRTFMDYVNVDFKFLTTIILLLCTIGAVVVYFPRVRSCFSLTFTAVWANSADNRLVILFLFSSEK